MKKGNHNYSILQGKEKCCFITGQIRGLHKHHIFHGTGRRGISDKNGFWVWLIPTLHNIGQNNLHKYPNMGLDLKLKKLCQMEYEKQYSHEEFMNLIGRNYLDKKDIEKKLPEGGFTLIQEGANE